VRLSLSVRIAEGFFSKETPTMTLAEVASLARTCGYGGICMRASQVSVRSSVATVDQAVRILSQHGLAVTMVTGDFDVVYNNDRGPRGLRDITPYLELAERLSSKLIRVAIKCDEDIRWAQRAADEALERGIRLAHQCHTQSLFETVPEIERTLRVIDRPNFGVIYEPANLELCGQDYGPDAVRRLAPWLENVYLQNQRLDPSGALELHTWCRGPVRFHQIPVHAPGGIRFDEVFEGLAAVGYEGPLTVHQSAVEGEPPQTTARETADYLRNLCPSVT
jgi:sugar phosphate isomerase/epimerase